MLFQKKELLNCLFFDIETYPLFDSISKLPNELSKVWLEKYHLRYLDKEITLRKQKIYLENLDSAINLFNHPNDVEINTKIDPDEIYRNYAALHPEFSKVLCIGVGLFSENFEIQTTCIQQEDEIEMLNEFYNFLSSDDLKSYRLAGYNIKGYDIPYLIKRSIINNISLPNVLQLRGKKPWEISCFDLAEEYKSNGEMISLHLLCILLGIQTPKDKFQNSEMISLLYSNKITISDVCEYCTKDIKSPMEICLQLLKD